MSLDDIAADLSALRDAAGGPSYAEISRRVAELRVARGVPERSAVPARTTIYDVFRSGRMRLNAELVADVAEALGADPDDRPEWMRRCAEGMRARETADQDAARPPLAPRADDPPPSSQQASAEAAWRGRDLDLPPDQLSALDAAVLERERPRESAARAAYAPPPEESSLLARVSGLRPWWGVRVAGLPVRTWRGVLLVLAACVAANLLGYLVVGLLSLPLFLDMTGTAVASIAFGPWAGIAVAVATHLVESASVPAALPFLAVDIVGALVWGYGARCVAGPQLVWRISALNALVGLACTLMAVPLSMHLFGGSIGFTTSGTVNVLVDRGWPLVFALFTANLAASIVDKVLSGLLAFGLVRGAEAPSPRDVRAGGLVGRPAARIHPSARCSGMSGIPE